MCAPVNVVLAGKLAIVTSNVIVADVMEPAVSFVTVIVALQVPLPSLSALVTAGTSFDGNNVALKMTFDVVGPVGVVGDLLPQPTTSKTSSSASGRCISILLRMWSVEFPAEVESHVDRDGKAAL